MKEKSWEKYLKNYAPLSYSEMIECCLLAEKESINNIDWEKISNNIKAGHFHLSAVKLTNWFKNQIEEQLK